MSNLALALKKGGVKDSKPILQTYGAENIGQGWSNWKRFGHMTDRAGIPCPFSLR